MSKDRLPPVDDSLIAWLTRAYPNRAIRYEDGTPIDVFALKAAREAGKQEVIDRLKSINRQLTEDPDQR